MSRTTTERLLKERSNLFTELSTLVLLLHGSWIERYSTCSRPECKCHQGQRHGPHYCLVINENGRQRQKYVPQSQKETALTGLSQYKRLQEIIDQITLINLAIIKEDAKRENK